MQNKIIIFLLIALMSGASIFSQYEIARIIILLLLFFIYYIRNHIVDTIIMNITIWFLIISVFTAVCFKLPFNILSFFSLLSYVYIPYLAIKIIGNNFWNEFERILYKMVIIVLPIYLMSLFFQPLFDSLYPVFTNITNDLFYVKSTQSGYWYGFFFTYSGKLDFRNSGFMWEPGAYAFCLIILLAAEISKNGLKINKKKIIYTISLITTFSTAGYIALCVIFLLYALQIRNLLMRIIGLSIIIFLVINVYQLDFMGDKIDRFIQGSNVDSIAASQIVEGKKEANRLYSFSISWKRSLKNPIGYGYDQEAARKSKPEYSDILTVNGLGDILVRWGWIGIIFVVISIYRFLRYINEDENIKKSSQLLLSMAILVCCFSNPISTNPLLWLVLLIPYCKDYSENQKNEKRMLSNRNSREISIS